MVFPAPEAPMLDLLTTKTVHFPSLAGDRLGKSSQVRNLQSILCGSRAGILAGFLLLALCPTPPDTGMTG